VDKNRLIYDDNLDALASHAEESIDLVYSDPPFSSNRVYNVLFTGEDGDESQALIQAFDDTWTWSPTTDEQYEARLRRGQPACR
jgi:adenine specific DNA methylase Mod